MTREELEEFRSLLQAWSDAGSANDGSGDIDATYDALCCFMTENAAELLSLAEEARWRSVTEEPPPFDSLILIAHPRPTGYLGRDGKWVAHGKFLDSHDYPKHWRPLPKGPER